MPIVSRVAPLRALLIGIVSPTIVSCGQQAATNATNSQNQVSAVDLIRQGSPEACSTLDAQEAVISRLRPEFRPDQANSSLDIEAGLASFSHSLDLITLGGVNRGAGTVTCDANLIVHQNGPQVLESRIRYVLRPSVEEAQGFAVSVLAPEATARLRALASGAIAVARQYRLQAEAMAAPRPNFTADGDMGLDPYVDDRPDEDYDMSPPNFDDPPAGSGNRQADVNGM